MVGTIVLIVRLSLFRWIIIFRGVEALESPVMSNRIVIHFRQWL